MPQKKGEEKLLYDHVQKIITGSSNLNNIVDQRRFLWPELIKYVYLLIPITIFY